LLMIVLGFLGAAHAGEDFESARKSIITCLNKEQSGCMAEFNTFFKRYDAVVINFFDKKNNEPLKAHIGHMETELQTLKSVCNDTRYGCINAILCTYQTYVEDLIALLKNYVGSHDTISLAFKVRKFKIILPEHVKSRGDISLFWSLYHRLRCEDKNSD
jgi:hypothetical protein